jgi:hypothetical protein
LNKKLKILGSQVDPPDPWPKPYLGFFKTMIITTFILTLTLLIHDRSLAPGWLPNQVFKTMIITTFILCWLRLTQVDLPNIWHGSYPESTLKLSFKTMIIIIFIFMFTEVNGELYLWLEHCPGSILESDFKIIIIIIFIFKLTLVNRSLNIKDPFIFFINFYPWGRWSTSIYYS